MTAPISPDPVRQWRPEFLPAYLSNGVIGIRVGRYPQAEGVAIVNGLASIQADEEVEGFARAPYPIAGDLDINGYSLRDLPERAELVEQRYDFACGELHTRYRFAGRDAGAVVDVLTYCSRSQPTCVIQETSITLDAPCQVRLTASIDPTGVPGRWLNRETKIPGSGNPEIDGCLRWEPPGSLTSCGAAYHTELEGAPSPQRSLEENNQLAPLETTYAFEASPGRRYVLRQLTSMVSSQFHEEPHREATRLATAAVLRGFAKLRDENRRAWAEIWRGRPVIVGADRRWQAMADAAFYYLQASAHSSSLFSTSMFGLAYWPNYHYYRGQVMWDIETFAFPNLLLTAPRTASSLLAFRSRRLDAAALNAALNGYTGLQFPWASSPLSGEEAIRTDAPLVTVEQHVNMSVAHAFALYWYATGDEEFARTRAWPVLRGVAAWIVSRVVETDRGFEIREALGPAEGRPHPVDNDAYVNMAAAVALRDAVAVGEHLGHPDAARWKEVADRLFIPIDGKRRIVKNHDEFTPEEGGAVGATPEALGGIFPFGFSLDADLERSTIDFYLDRIDPYLGSPMLCAPLGVFAAWNGDRARSLELFQKGYAEYVNEPWSDVNEYSRVRHPEKPVVGPLFANLGGFLLALYAGLPGMRIGSGAPDTWFERPVVMPEGWDGIEVDRLFVRGEPRRLVAHHGMERGRFEPAT